MTQAAHAPHAVGGARRLLEVLFLSARPFAAALVRGVTWGSKHSGVPVIVIAAVAVVVSYRIARRSARFALEVSFVLALLAALGRLGLLRF